jgi:hypothetical protein
MTITTARIYFFAKNEKVEKQITRTHWGFADWFKARLKPIRDQLRGDEAKGVNIVNFMLYEDPIRAFKLNEWTRRANTFNFDLVFDIQSLQNTKPIDNVQMLMKVAAEIAKKAPWPQVIAVGNALASPLTETEKLRLLPHLQWPRMLDIGGGVKIDPRDYK